MTILERTEPMTEAPSLRIPFSDLRRYTDLLYEKTGVRFGPKRFGAVRTGILHRMKALGHATLEQYLSYVEHPDNAAEWKAAAEAMVSGWGV